MSVRRRRADWAAIAAVLVLATACGSATNATPPLCQFGGASALCLQHDGGDVRVSGHGFQPGSDVQVDMADGGGQLVLVAPDGTFPSPGRTVGFLPGATPEAHRLDAVDQAGRPVTYVIRCAVDTSRQARCAF